MITGANGFIGSHLCSELKVRGNEVVPIVRTRAVVGTVAVDDIGPTTDWQAALATQPDVIVHLAARADVMKKTDADAVDELMRVNVAGSLHLARQAAAMGVKRIVYLSSIKVNGEGNSPNRPFKADDKPAPEDAYAISKTEAEQGLRYIARETGIEVVFVRSTLVYGPNVKGNFSTLIHWICKGIPLPLSAVNNLRSLVAVDNLVDFLILCADRDRSARAANEVFLISDGEDVSTTELLLKIARAYRITPRLFPIPAGWMYAVARLLRKRPVAERLLGSLVVDGSKARELLGWRPVVSMDEQLKKMALYDSRV